MAAETPFGASFGDPRRYMGQSPLAEIGKAAKTFLTGYALKESGLTDYLNKLGQKPEQQTVVQGAAPVPPSFNQSLAPVAPTVAQPPLAAPMAIPPLAPAQQGVMVNPIPQNEMPPSDIGEQVLDGKWTGFPSAPQPTAPISLQNPTDFNPLAPDTSNQVALTGSEYQQTPGLGSAQEKAGKLMKIMGMG